MQFKAGAVGEKDNWINVTVEHGNNHPVEFNIAFKNGIPDGAKCFRDINKYLEWLENGDYSKTDKLFDAICRAHSILQPININVIKVHTELHNIIIDIMDCVKYDTLSYWYGMQRHFNHPPDIHNEKNNNFVAERTYNLDEYNELVKFSIMLKPLLPIWGAYYERIKSVTKGKAESKLIKLIESTELFTLAAYDRHLEFVKGIFNNFELSAAAIHDGYNSFEIDELCFSISVMRLALTGVTWHSDDVSDPKDIINQVSECYKEITKCKNNINKGTMTTCTDKVVNHSLEGDNLSIAENLTAKEDVSEVSKAFFDFYGMRYKSIAKSIYPAIDISMLEELIDFNQSRKNFVPVYIQYKIASLVVGKKVGIRSIPYTDRVPAINIMSIAELVCFELGFPNIGALIMASLKTDEHGCPYKVTDRKFLRNSILASQEEILDEYYRLRIKNIDNKGVKKAAQLNNTIKGYKNPGVLACEAICNELDCFIWNVALPDELESKITLPYNHELGGHIIKEDMRREVADFLIELNRTIYKK